MSFRRFLSGLVLLLGVVALSACHFFVGSYSVADGGSGADSPAVDAQQQDTLTSDTSQRDTVQVDTAGVDTARTDTSRVDIAQADTSLPDIAQADTSLPDITQADTSLPDTSLPDTSLPDLARPDTAAPDVAVFQAGQFCVGIGGGGGLPCVSNIECAIGGILDWLYCGGAGYCVQCTQDSHCSAGPETTEFCLSERCRGCSSDDDCLVTDIWRRCEAGRCQICVEDSDCLLGPGNTGKCIYNQCIKCEYDADCVASGRGAGCDLSGNLCFDCYDDRDCSAGSGQTSYCVQNTCHGCLSVADCTAADFSAICVCTADNPATVDENEETCLPGQTCVDGGCVTCDGGSCPGECEGGYCGTPP